MTSHTIAERRPLRLDSIDAVQADVGRLVAAQHAGHLAAAGNWTAAQIFDHLARAIEYSYEGFPFQAAWPVRACCGLAKRLAWPSYLRWAYHPGHTLPARAAALLPDEWADFDIAAMRYCAALSRIAHGEPMTHPSPWEGKLSHRQWVDLHLCHAELHLSFLDETA
ncbi:MAG: DUF1569 domain-containing protein [Planctomycetota bacterium]|nr:MAG: DUF1569 domain-containing protein [Planctomycetota bacterium]